MSFYITLPSNASMDEFPSNSQTNYTTLLQNTLNLDGPYEVALSEISYSSDFQVDLGTVNINNPFFKEFKNDLMLNKEIIQANVIGKNAITREDLVVLLNESIINAIIKIEYNRRFNLAYGWDSFVAARTKRTIIQTKIVEILLYDKFVEIIDSQFSLNHEIYLAAKGNYLLDYSKWMFDLEHLEYLKENLKKDNIVKISDTPSQAFNDYYNKDIYTEIKNELKTLDKYIPVFSIDNDKIKISYKEKAAIIFTGLMDNIFRDFYEEHNFTERIFIVPSLLTFINYILIYTDIIQEQYFGNKLTQNLRTITVRSDNKGDIATFYENPHYVPVSKTLINTINIQLRDIFGNSVRFKDFFSYVIIKLHFRKLQ